MDNIIKKFRNKLYSNEYVYGIFNKTIDPMFIEIQGIANYDFVILDTEHGPSGVSEQQNNIRAALLRNILPIVRVSELTESNISKACDIGALGIQVPQIKNAKQAKEAIKYVRFYPYGERGVCRFVRAADYSAKDREVYFEESKDLLVILQIEGVEAINNLDEILQVEGYDILFIGPYDLSQSLKVPGDIKNPKVLDTMITIVEKAKEKGIVVGTFTDDYDMVLKWKKLGVQYISYSTDAGMFYDYSKNVNNQLKLCGQNNKEVLILDSTLKEILDKRKFKLKRNHIRLIVKALEQSGIQYIECGMLKKDGDSDGYIKGFNSINEANNILGIKQNISNCNYVLSIDCRDCSINQIEEFIGYGVNCIKVIFDKKQERDAFNICCDIKNKGYKLLIQVTETSYYSDTEWKNLIERFNELKPEAFYIVDSFGTMKYYDLIRYYNILEKVIYDKTNIGFFINNSMQLALSNTINLINNTDKILLIDCSIYGIGCGAGNLNTELLQQYLNNNYNAKYNVVPILEIIDSIINRIYNKEPWGYSLPNYLAASYKIHPKYSKYLMAKNKLSLKDINNIFSMIDIKKKYDFDIEYIESIYESYQDNILDEDSEDKIYSLFKDKNIVVIAPGKSIEEHRKDILEDKYKNYIIISVNYMYDEDITDYIFVGNMRRMVNLPNQYRKKVIATSNIPDNNVLGKVSYSKLLNKQSYVRDNSGLMLLKLLKIAQCRSIKVYGMDGYKYNASENYLLDEMEIVNTIEQFDNMNLGMNIIKKEYKKLGVKFV